jgi:hypothetical protein
MSGWTAKKSGLDGDCRPGSPGRQCLFDFLSTEPPEADSRGSREYRRLRDEGSRSCFTAHGIYPHCKRTQMPPKHTAVGTILIRENTLLPAGVEIESEDFLPGWRVARNLNGYGLARKVEGAGWHFFFLAGQLRATVLGSEGPGAQRRAVKLVLAKRKGHKYNCLQITKVVEKKFLFIPFVKFTAHFRHIQKSIGLVPAKDFVLETPEDTPNQAVNSKKLAAAASNS